SINQPNGVYSYTVVVNEGNACSAVSLPFEVTVNAAPVVDVIITDDQICAGGTFNVAAQVDDWNAENLTYAWTANGAAISNTTASFNTTANVTTIYQVTVTQTTSGCVATGSATVTVNTPTVVMNPIATPNICEGAQITLEAVTANDANLGAPAYQWFVNGQIIPGAVTSTYTYSPLVVDGDQTVYTYTVEVTYPESGCVIAPIAYVGNVVTVTPNPVVVISGDNIVCENGVISLTANVTRGTATTYTWYNYNNVIAGQSTANLVINPAVASINEPNGVYSYTVVVNEGNPCSAASLPFEVTVSAAPVVNITATSNTICVGAQVTLTANLDNYNTDNITYQWSDGNGIINGATQATYTTPALNNVANYNYSVTVTQTTSGCIATNTTTIAVVADPVITVSIDTAAMCTGGSVTLTATVAGGLNTENVTYVWSVNGTAIAGASQSTYTTTIYQSGEYNFSATVAQTDDYYITGCASTNYSVATVTVYEQPEVYISSMGLVDACEGGTITLYAQVYGDTAITNNMDYNWRINGWDTLSVNSSIYNTNPNLPVGSYVYTVVVTTDLKACRVISDAINTRVVEDPSWSRNIVAYPVICVGDEITLYAQVQDGLGGTIQWVREDTTLYIPTEIGTGGLTYDIPEANGYIYYPVFTPHVNMSGCDLANGDTTLVHVHARPTATATTSAGSDVVCKGEPADIIVSFTGIAPYTYYVQNMMNGSAVEFITYNNPDTLTVYPNETTIYQIYQMSNNVCDVAPNEAAVYVTVVVSNIQFTDLIYETGCDTADMNAVLTFDVISGGYPAQQTYTVYTANGTFVQTGVIINNSLTIDMTGYAAGDYDFIVDIDSCTYPTTVRVQMGSAVVEQRWDDVLVCNNNPANNGGYNFVSYQWYKNGAPIAGATGQYYNEIGGLNGEYYLWIKDDNGNEYWTCPQMFRTDVAISVYPNPANVDQIITIELPFTPEQLEGAVLDIYDAKGALVQHVENLQPITKVSGFKAQGAYFGRILTGTNEIKTVKFIIVK
ncbi:MAG TPA: T9SS type A sorting domain-containing protein, partial [Bacteroidales bacterium]|nr:T9SS type A sorting domain-containing protein [Bacteroidales bacterium]